MIHILNEETEAQGDKVTCPNPTADPGLQKPCAFLCTLVLLRHPPDLLLRPAVSPTSPSQFPHQYRFLLPGNSCFSEDEDTWLALSWGPHLLQTPPVLLKTPGHAPPEKTNSLIFCKDLG